MASFKTWMMATVGWVSAVGVAVVAGGCVQGSLATSTGPRPVGNRWSAAKAQEVHVGETVEFDFVLHDGMNHFVSPGGVADYCVATIGETRTEAIADPTGHFNFSHTFKGVAAGDVVEVRVDAFRQRGGKDYVQIGGQWLATQTYSHDPDARVAGGSVRLTAYQSVVDFRLPRPADDFDPETGVLRLRRPDGVTKSIYLNRPMRRGFILEGPEPAGYYRVTYQPRGDEVATTGKTDVTFTIYDVAGQRHVERLELDTP
jgi:hypothetical protein